jgi:hypothetical protein
LILSVFLEQGKEEILAILSTTNEIALEVMCEYAHFDRVDGNGIFYVTPQKNP